MSILSFQINREKRRKVKRTYVASLHRKAYSLWKEKKVKEAVRCIGKIAQFPFLEERDRIFYYLGEFDRVTEGFNRVYDLNCVSADEWNKIGVDLTFTGTYEEALLCFDRALDVEPYYAKAWYNRAMALDKQKRFEESLRSFDIALLIKPDFSEALKERERLRNYISEEI